MIGNYDSKYILIWIVSSLNSIWTIFYFYSKWIKRFSFLYNPYFLWKFSLKGILIKTNRCVGGMDLLSCVVVWRSEPLCLFPRYLCKSDLWNSRCYYLNWFLKNVKKLYPFINYCYWNTRAIEKKSQAIRSFHKFWIYS